MAYDDYRPESSLDWGAGGKELTRVIYLRAVDEVEVLANALCPQRGYGVDIGPGSLTDYVYCDTVQVQQIEAAAGSQAGLFLFRVTAKYKPLGMRSSGGVVNKARWSISFRAQPYTRRHVDEESQQTHYGPTTGGGTPPYPVVTTGINVDEDGAQGVEVDEMVEVLSIDFFKHPSAVSSFLDDVRDIAGTVNQAAFVGPWGTYAAGEARITGLSVTVTSGEMATVGVEISRSKNAESVDVLLDTMVNPVTYSKKGWEYLWIRYLKATNDSDVDVRPMSIDLHVAQVYEEGDFSALGISEEIWS